MEEVHTQTIWGHDNDAPPDSSPNSPSNSHEPPLSRDDPTLVLQPGETLITYHPHSWCPMRIVPTTELHVPSERAIRHDIKKPEDSYAPFPTRADFEQAEVSVNNNCSNKFIDTQLKFECQNGMHLKVQTSRKMHELLARGIEGDSMDDFKVSSVHSISERITPLTGPFSVSSGGDHGSIR